MVVAQFLSYDMQLKSHFSHILVNQVKAPQTLKVSFKDADTV